MNLDAEQSDQEQKWAAQQRAASLARAVRRLLRLKSKARELYAPIDRALERLAKLTTEGEVIDAGKAGKFRLLDNSHPVKWPLWGHGRVPRYELEPVGTARRAAPKSPKSPHSKQGAPRRGVPTSKGAK